jgi:hypothetical protein
MRIFLIYFIFSLFVVGCGGTFKRPGEKEPMESPEVRPKEFDPLGLPQDSEIIPINYPLDKTSDSAVVYDSSSIRLTADPSVSIGGTSEAYRIQLFTSKTYGDAARELKIATEVFDRQIFLDYEVPYYKVRWGDFASREEADEYLQAAIEAGYRTAWVVKINIGVQNIEDVYEDEDIPPLIDIPDTSQTVPEQYDDRPEYPEN